MNGLLEKPKLGLAQNAKVPIGIKKENNMKVNLSYPKCKHCGGETRKIKIFEAPDEEHLEQKVFKDYGLRCLKCNKIEEYFVYKIKIEEPCCKGMEENLYNEYGGIEAQYDTESGLLDWSVDSEEWAGLDGMKFCPFCGVELPTKPSSFIGPKIDSFKI